ncbi:MAG: tripartite tricarboxylate transporter substrate binding protein [Candidatus Parcubacteria bacterium]|nr:tripartite tricarboxylate transporter substrate binding protein [Burkholderiales bacterium]
MKMLSRFLPLLLAALLPSLALSQAYPQRPVRVLIGYPPGGSNDLVIRTLSTRLSEVLKQPFIIDNRSGAAGTIAADVAAKSAPDGYTLYSMSSAQVLAPHVRKVVNYDPVRDFRPIALVASAGYFLTVHPSISPTTVAELVALAKAKPGALSYSSSGVGAGPHLTFALFLAMSGVDIVHVPNRLEVLDLLPGRVQASFASIASVYPHLQAGALRAIAVSSAERSALMPNLPTMAESGYPGFDMGAWWGLVAPAGTPDAITKVLVDAIRPILESKTFSDQFAAQGIVAGKLYTDAFGRKIVDDEKRFADIVRRAGVVPE